jgi:hypothetical protein
VSYPSAPAIQVTVSLTPELRTWGDVFLDGSPLLAVETGSAELCLILDAEEVTDRHVEAARKFASDAVAFARAVQQRHLLWIEARCRLEAAA